MRPWSLLLALAVCCCSGLLLAVRADYYDLAEEDLAYAYPSVRRVIGMYSLEDSPSLFGAAKVQPYIQLDLKFSTYKGLFNGVVREHGDTTPAAGGDKPVAGEAPATGTPAAGGDAPVTGTPAAGDAANKPQARLHRFRTLADSEEPKIPAPADVDEAAAALKEKAKENADVPVNTSSETVTPEQAEVNKEAAAATEGKAPAAATPRTPVRSPYPIVQVLIMQDTTLDSIGHWDSTDNTLIDYCCTPDLFALNIDGCNEIGTLIVKGGTVHKIMSAAFADDATHAHLSGADGRYDVTTTGEHILIVSNCDARLANLETNISGGGVWKNPFGYLPGRLFGFLPFYFGMFIVYVFITCSWGLMLFIHRKEVAGIQYFITTALFFTLIEVLAWFIDYYNFNASGVRHMGGVITAILLTVLRLTVSRMLVVSVAIGYPVVRPNLSFSSSLQQFQNQMKKKKKKKRKSTATARPTQCSSENSALCLAVHHLLDIMHCFIPAQLLACMHLSCSKLETFL